MYTGVLKFPLPCKINHKQSPDIHARKLYKYLIKVLFITVSEIAIFISAIFLHTKIRDLVINFPCSKCPLAEAFVEKHLDMDNINSKNTSSSNSGSFRNELYRLRGLNQTMQGFIPKPELRTEENLIVP